MQKTAGSISMKKLHRISAADARSLREGLAKAFFSLDTLERTQRREFLTMMPQLYRLRKIGSYTFKQITSLLRDLGFKLSESSVRVYYSEYIGGLQEDLDRQLDEESSLLEEIRKETLGLDTSLIGAKVEEIMERKGHLNSSF